MTVPASTASIWYGVVSDAGLANRALTDAELTELSDTPPPVSARDKGWFRAASKVRIAFKSERMADYSVPRALATFPGTGASATQRIQPGIAGSRFSVRLMIVDVGRPFAISSVRLVMEDLERGDEISVNLPFFKGGMDRGTPPMHLAMGKAWNLLNASYQGGEFRSRRGNLIINNEITTDVDGKPSAYFDATDASGNTYHLVLIAGTLYTIDNGELIEVDSGWPQDEIPTVATVGLKTFIASKSRVRVFQAGTVYEPGIAAPTDAPIFVDSTPNTTGGVVAISPGYEYVYCFFDGTRLTESGPSGVTFVELPPGSTPSTINLTIGVSGSSTVSERRLYRRKRGTETWFRVATVSDNTTTTVSDAAELVPDVNATLDSPEGFFVTADFPNGTSVAAVEGRLLVWRDFDDQRIVYISEVGDGERYYPFNAVTCEGEMRAALSHEGRVLLGTDRTLEVIEGDWVRGSAGTLGIQKRVLDRSKGVFGPFAMCAARGRAFVADRNGVHVVGAGFVLKDTTDTISAEVQGIVKAAVDTAGSGVVMAFNDVSQELNILLSQATGDSADPKNRVRLALNLENGSWSVNGESLSWIGTVFDGLLGSRFVGCDYHGVLKELDVYNGDGVQGDESWIPPDATTTPNNVLTGASASAGTVTIATASFPTAGSIRGVGVVLEDVSAGVFYPRTILSATGTALTLDDVPSVIGVGDKVWVGGIYSYVDSKEVDGGRATRKKLVRVEVGLVDCTISDF